MDITKRNRYEGSSNGRRMLHSVKVQIRRGAELLDELAGILPNLYSFNNESDLDFASTVTLLHKYWNGLKVRVEKVTQNVEASLFVS
jgi:hypothetical protein